MIDKLEIFALKSIDNLTINCKKLNLLTGTNSSGKSTVLQSLLLIAQNLNIDKCGLNGEIVSLGEFRDVRNFNTDSKKIQIKISNNNNEYIELCLKDEKEDISLQIQPLNTHLTNKMKYSNGNFHYLSCQRIGHQDTYLKNLSKFDFVGFNGEYSLYYLMKHTSDNLEDALIKDSVKVTLGFQVNYWLNYIVNATVSTEDIVGTDVLKAYYTLIDGNKVRPKNVGSGIGYIVSVIIMCLSSQKDDIIIIENPEIHLHPLSQSRVCDFLYFIANAGRQVFVETHSDHLFNGIRAGIATNKMDANYISVNFLALDNKNCSINTEIIFGKRGKILNHTSGLFDQFDIDLNKMLKL